MIAEVWGLNYIRWHIMFTILPTIFLWGVWGTYFLKYKKTIVVISALCLFWGFVFDIVAGPLLHVWYWPEAGKLGIWWWHLPLEEYLFLLIVPQELTCIFLLLRRVLYK